MSICQLHCTLEKYILKSIYPKSENLPQSNLSQIHLLKKLLQMVLRSSQETNLKIPLQAHTHSLKKLSNYIEAPYLAPMFTSKPIIITLFCPEAKPRDKLSQSIISIQLFFPEKSKHKHGHCLRLIPGNLAERASFYHVGGE